jgi:hypothetical protein
MRTISDEVDARRRERSEEDYEPERIGRFECVLERPTSILVRAVANALDERWVPKSCVHEDSEVYKDGTDGELVVVHWFADKKGWV